MFVRHSVPAAAQRLSGQGGQDRRLLCGGPHGEQVGEDGLGLAVAGEERFDGDTQAALRRFQRERGLPSTGIPDDATVRKLGLDPRDVFKSSVPRRDASP